ncbi:hypothetical protein PFISCL1PPCAC_22376 [Pristionchus fissidentatus]|uniref:BTB domain-containing protein n=1 Tax=Pristionchus fissidentatus TaxID=1538716 RepID=A0AAV5WK23_9BILA|nr:hypothetical protein PFISCL1PPCAC_22376 [Pristionchus fissidentatus]
MTSTNPPILCAFAGITKMASYGVKTSRVWHCGDLPWHLYVQIETSSRTDNKKCLGLFLTCNDEVDEAAKWSAEGTHTISLLNQIPGLQNMSKTVYGKFTATSKSWGFSKFIEWDLLMDPAMGFLVKDTIVVQVTSNVTKTTGVRSSIKFDFSSPGFGDDGIVLKIEGKKVHVGKNYLSTHSPVFAAMFFGNFAEKDKTEIELKDVAHEDFVELMYVIHPSFREVNKSSYKPLLALADRFQMKYATEAVESCHPGEDYDTHSLVNPFPPPSRLQYQTLR